MRHPSRNKKRKTSRQRPGSGPARRPQPRREAARGQTGAEEQWLRYLVDKDVPVLVRLRNNDEVRGRLQSQSSESIRLSRQDGSELVISKHEIKYLAEQLGQVP